MATGYAGEGLIKQGGWGLFFCTYQQMLYGGFENGQFPMC